MDQKCPQRQVVVWSPMLAGWGGWSEICQKCSVVAKTPDCCFPFESFINGVPLRGRKKEKLKLKHTKKSRIKMKYFIMDRNGTLNVKPQ